MTGKKVSVGGGVGLDSLTISVNGSINDIRMRNAACLRDSYRRRA